MISPTPNMIAEKVGPIGRLVFNKPHKHNATSTDMWEAIPVILDEFEKDPAIRVVVVTMLEGGDLQEHSAPGPITIHALAGAIDVTVEGRSNVLEAGEIIALAPGVRHGVRCLKDGNFLLTIGVFLREPDRGGRHDEIQEHDRLFEQ